MIFKKNITLILIVILCCTKSIYPGDTGKLAGKITDKATSEPLVGANILIISRWVEGKEVKLDFTMGAATDLDGDFYILNIQPGLYSVKASYVGYLSEIQTKVEIYVDKTTNINFQLASQVVTSDEVLVVGYQKGNVESDLTATKNTYDVGKIESLPGVNDIGDIVGLQADVSDGHFRGGRTGESLYLIGGSSIVNPLNNSTSFDPMTLAFQQVEVYTSGFSAEYGNVQSGVINMVTKEGTNQWETRADISSTNAYYKTWGGSVYNARNNYFFTLMNNPEQWIDGVDPASGKILWTHFGINYPENYLPPVPLTFPPTKLTREDSLRTAELVRTLWLQSVKDIGLEYDKPDYRVDLSLSGPLAQNATIFMAARLSSVNPILPSSEPDIQRQVISQIVYRQSNSNKFKLIFNYNDQTTNEFDDNFFRYFEKVFNVVINTNEAYQYGLEWNHIFDQSTFLDVKLGLLSTFDEDQVNLLGPDELSTSYNDNSNWRFYTDPSGHTVGSLSTSNGTSKTNSYSFNTSITSQINKNNLVKSGLQLSYYDMDIDRRSGASNLSSLRLEKYHVYPFEGAFYAQDKMEFQGMIANIGLRWDFYDFNTSYYLDKFSPYRNPEFNPLDATSKQYSGELAAKADTKLTSVLQPRIGISFPVDEKTVLHLNYGVFTQRPAFQYIYVDRYKLAPEPNCVRLGNPELKPERTISYDVGIVRSLPLGFYLDLSAYLKDVSNLLQYAIYVDNAGNQYETFINKEYANIKGFHINLEKNDGLIRGFVRYNWQSATGKSAAVLGSTARTVLYESDPASDILPAPEDIYLDYDRTHKVLVNLTLQTGDGTDFSLFGTDILKDFSLSATFRFQTGRPFTYDASGQGLRFNLRTPDERDLKIRISKKISVGNTDLNFYVEGYNVLNQKSFNYDRTFSEDPTNPYRAIFVEDIANLMTERQFAPYTTNIESYLIGNTPRYFRFGVDLRF
jgi:outer membrane receptor protein involved in Fe transport